MTRLKKKISLFCNVDPRAVIAAPDVTHIYQVPLEYAKESLDDLVIEMLNLPDRPSNLDDWKAIVHRLYYPKHKVKIAVVGKYVQLKDSYKSLAEAFTHGGIANEASVDLNWIDSGQLETHGPETLLKDHCGILVPGGFGDRGIEGKILSAQYARENRIPFFGICLGMQISVIEFCRNVCGLKDANSSEFNDRTPHPVIDFLPGQEQIKKLGGTLRLGAYSCLLADGSKARLAYGAEMIQERHRHRYEFNNAYREIIQKHGMQISGISPDQSLVEIVELADHPWFVAVQFHPEFKSSPRKPHPLFAAFVKSALEGSECLA